MGLPAAGPIPYARHPELEAELEAAGLASVAELEFDLLPVIAGMEKAGVGVDVSAWAELVDQAERELVAQRGTLAALGLSQPEDDAQVREAIVGRDLSVTSTSWKALTLYMQDPLVAALVPYRRAAGFLDSTGRAVLEAARRGNGRVRGRFDPLAAPTGRMACSKPNLLGIPKDPAYRRCIVPPAGHALVVADYAAIELRVLAEVTGDPALKKVFVEGGDPHAATAAALLGKTVAEVTKHERQRAKAVNFGFAFGMGAPKFVEYAQGSYGLAVTQEEAQRMRIAFLSEYAGVAAWQRKIKREMPLEMRTASGRRRIFKSQTGEFCERLNTPVQGTAADGLKLAMVLLHRRLPECGARLVLAIHDELLVEAPEDRARDVQDVVEKTMIEGMARFVRSVPIKVEASVRRNWADPL
jgi:DNA polymerase-1